MESNSNSGFILQTDPLSEFNTSEYGEIIDKGFYRLCKVKRYGKWYFLKSLRPEFAELTTYKTFLKKEFEIEIQLDHPNIVHAISWENNEKFGECIIMEYVDGLTLNDFLQTNPSKQTRKKIISEILSAMKCFHSAQIVHRDIKPQNILITHKGHNVKIIDFGISDSDTYAIFKQPAGSDGFAAPEQLDRNAITDQRCDIYAFGKILQLLFPHKYWLIRRKCLQYNPQHRFFDAAEITNRFRIRKYIAATIPLCIVLIGIFASELFLFQENKRLKEHNTIDSVFVYTKDTVFIRDTLSEKIAAKQKLLDDEKEKSKRIYKKFDKEISALAKPILKNFNSNKYNTQTEALDDITLFRKQVQEMLQTTMDTTKSSKKQEYIEYIGQKSIFYELQFTPLIQEIPIVY